MEVVPQEEPVVGNDREDVVPQPAPSENGTAELEREIQSDVVTKEVSNVVVSEPIEEEPLASEPEANEVTTVESNVSDDVDDVVQTVVSPEVSKAEVVDESLDSGLVEEVSNETPTETVEEIAEDTAKQEAPAEQVAEEVMQEECVETVAPVEEVEEGVPVIEQVVDVVPIELPLVEETGIEDAIERVNGMPVLTKEDDPKEETEKMDETDQALSQLEEVPQTRPVEVKESAIPPHILGHAFEVDDEVRNGKVRKPRLGVKIPYRNLTSQIVSKQDIADEIMERSRLRNLTAEVPEGGDILFTKKLTKRLATKIAPTSKNESSKSTSSSPKKGHEGDHKTSIVAIPSSPKTTVSNSTVTKKLMDTSTKITDNSDLIAILEGDDDDWELMRPKGKPVEKRTPEWERETALKQLRELPKHRSYSKASSSSFKIAPEKPKPPQNVEPVEEDPLCIPDDIQEPKFAMGLVTKTYTRKRKSSEDLKLLASTILQSQKKIIGDKEKKSSSPQPEKVSSHSKPKTYSHKSSPSKHEKHSEMPSLKKESSVPVAQKHSTIPTLTPNVDKPEKVINLQPQIIITKTVIEPKTPEPRTPTVVKTPLSSPNTYISKSSRIVKKKKIWDPDEDSAPKYFKIPSLRSPTENASEKKIPTDTSHAKPAVLKPNNDKTPIIKKPSIKKIISKKKKPKRLTEIDRLLMDEGAVNLLYAVKNTDEVPTDKRKKGKDIISIDRAQRELQNKTNEIKNNLQINSTKDSPISLRKKEGPSKVTPTREIAAAVLQRKKSTGSTHSPPASPAFYNQHAEASRIIRRHSSSSFSSENPEGDETYTEKSSKAQRKKVRSHSSSTFIIKHQPSEENEVNSPDMKYSQFGTFTVITFKNFVQIVMSPLPSGQISLSVDALTELRAMLHLLANDDNCSVVLFSSAGTTFCDGLDYKELYCNNKIECLNIAENYARCVRDFLISLAQFPKLLVAGVNGNAMGLGVTMLPLFDMVFASDSAMFSTPYAALGCAAEGAALLTAPHSMHTALASELFFTSRRLTASEALRLGLVTRTLWPDKFQAELLAVMNTVANQSLQSMQAIKMQLKDHLLSDVETLLKSESSILVQLWTSKECQNNFMNYSVSK